jgi:CheY-like chemotaxis protein
MLAGPQWLGDVFMDDSSQWLLAGLGLCLLAGWLGYRTLRGIAARRKNGRAAAEAAARAKAQHLLAEELARRGEQHRAAALQAARAEAVRLAQEAAARAEAASAAATEAARVQAARLAEAQLARQRAARQSAEQDERERLAGLVRPPAPPPTPAPPAVARVAKTPDQTLVLVADDSKVVRVKTGRLLAQHEYRVAYATDGLDAARQLQASCPDIVITDVEMPGMDGFELTRHVRQDPRTAHIPVIMITAADDRHREAANAAGVSVLLGKPYREDELIARIRLAMQPARTLPGVSADHVSGGARSELDAVA